jgi:hypothetical protein
MGNQAKLAAHKVRVTASDFAVFCSPSFFAHCVYYDSHYIVLCFRSPVEMRNNLGIKFCC